jgi:hypothetical protein
MHANKQVSTPTGADCQLLQTHAGNNNGCEPIALPAAKQEHYYVTM